MCRGPIFGADFGSAAQVLVWYDWSAVKGIGIDFTGRVKGGVPRVRAEAAARLAGWAAWRRTPGVRGALGRWAWYRLVRAGNAGDGAAIDAVWGLWLRDPAEETWDLLGGWRPDSWLRRAALEAAVDPDRSSRAREAIGRFCGRHGLAPDDAVDQAVFFVLTGQAESHRAGDPDGTLLVSAYEATTAATRAELRRAIVSAGDLHVVRALTRTDRYMTEMTGAEIDELARRLAHDHVWAELWQLACDAPLPQAVTAARLVEGWRPDGEAGRRFFDRLAAMDRESVESLAAAWVTPVRIHGTMINEVAFAPDASQIVVATSSDVAVYSLPAGRHVRTTSRRAEGLGRPITGGVVHLGDDVVFAERHDKRRARPGSGDLGDWWVMYWQPPSSVGLVWPKHGTTFLCVKPVYRPVRYVAVEERLLQFVGRDGEQWITPADIGLAEGWTFADLATEPMRGRIAVVVQSHDDDRRDIVLMNSALRLIARSGGDDARTVGPVTFCGPDRLLTVDKSDLSIKSWRTSGESLIVAAAAEEGGWLAPVPTMGLVAIDRDGVMTWRDGQTLAPVEAPATLRSRWPSSVSPGGEFVAVRTGDGVDVYDLRRLQTAELITRPPTNARPGDMAALEGHDLGPEAAELLAIHRARLEHRLTRPTTQNPSTPARRPNDSA
jgi:hypothetical protein